jgi:hypothetical protein
MATTPLEREILTHYWTAAPGTPFPRMSPPAAAALERFTALNILSPTGTGGSLCADQNALAVYMAALAAVPLPTREWVIREPATAAPPPRPKPLQPSETSASLPYVESAAGRITFADQESADNFSAATAGLLRHPKGVQEIDD